MSSQTHPPGPMTSPSTLLLVVAVCVTALATVCPVRAGDPDPPPCISGPVPHEVRFDVTALTELDEFTLDPTPEMFMHVFLDDEFLCEVDGANGWSFSGSCTFDIEEPYLPVRIRFLLWDSDPPLDDYTVDIGPDEALDFEFQYNPPCGTIGAKGGLIVGCAEDNAQAECRGKRTIEGVEGRVSFEVVPVDGIPIVENSLTILNMEAIQVVPNPSAMVADRQTVVRLDIGSSHPIEKTATVAVQALDRADNLYTDFHDVTVPACGVVRKEVFFGPEWEAPGGEPGFRPQTGFGNFFLIGAEVDPVADCGPTADPPCQGEVDCRVVDGEVIESELGLRAGRELEVFYQPFLSRSKVICNTSVEEGLPPGAASSSQELLEDIYPASVVTSRDTSLRVAWPLPIGEPLLDIVDLIDPRPGLALLELAGAIAGLDRWVLVTYQGGLGCNWPSLDTTDAPGAAAGDLSRASLAEPRNDGEDFPEVVAHEMAHTWGMSEWPCPIEDDLFGGIKCEDEYNYPPEALVSGNGVRSEGFQVLRWQIGEASSVRDMDGRACIMGSSSPGTPNAWVDKWDYERVLENVTDTTTAGPALFLRTRLTPGFGGTFQRSDVSRITAIPTQPLDSFSGRSPFSHTTSLRLKRMDGSTIDTISFTLENVDLDADGVNDAFAGEHGMGTLDFLDASWIVPLPADARTIELVRRTPTGPASFTEAVTDVLTLESPPVSVTLLAPITIFEAHELEWYRFEWEFAFGGRDAGSGSAEAVRGPGVATKSYVFMTEDEGETWIPVGAYLDGTGFDWQAPRDGRFGVRVFATSGFETGEFFPFPDLDKDGCHDQIDPDGDLADPDGADLDGVAQVCDLCPDDYDPLQLDQDHDGLGNACDTCPEKYDPQQSDIDNDGAGDACDCAGNNPTAFAPAALVLPLTMTSLGQGTVQLDWPSQVETSGSGVRYDVVTGSLSQLRSDGGFTNASCDVQATTVPTATDGGLPQPGDGEWYLVRARNRCAIAGYDSGGAGQLTPRDAQIDGATSNCNVCSHDRCDPGPPLDPNCGSCIGQICDADDFCCNNAWDNFCIAQVRSVCNILTCDSEQGNCAHDQCELGVPLTAGCDAAFSDCVAQVCAADSFCCTDAWDNACIGEVASVCGLTCE